MKTRLLKTLFFGLLVKPLVLIALGLNISWRERLPLDGPAILVANHNSHLDALVLMSLFPLRIIHKIRPVAAADYFLGHGKLLAWFSTHCLGIIPVDRSGAGDLQELFARCHRALDDEHILIIFPEGSRGRPEELSRLKKGVFYIVKERSQTPIIPIVMHGLGRALPKGEALFVPYNCDVVVGETLLRTSTSAELVSSLTEQFQQLASYCLTRHKTDPAEPDDG